MKLHLRRPSVRGHIPSGATRVEDNQPDGRWVLQEDTEDFRKGARMNGYNLNASAKVLPEGATFRNGNRRITLLKGRWVTRSGAETDPLYGEE